jgi:hypothetical protein
MAKAKKRAAARKKSSKRDKASAKPARKKAAKHATLKKSKAQRAGMSANKSAARKKRTREAVEARPVAEMPVETPIIDAIEETAPLAVAVTEYQSVQTAISSSTGGELEEGEGLSSTGASPIAPDQGERPEHEARAA